MRLAKVGSPRTTAAIYVFQRTSGVYPGLPVGAFSAASKSWSGIESKIARSCLTTGTGLTNSPFTLSL